VAAGEVGSVEPRGRGEVTIGRRADGTDAGGASVVAEGVVVEGRGEGETDSVIMLDTGSSDDGIVAALANVDDPRAAGEPPLGERAQTTNAATTESARIAAATIGGRGRRPCGVTVSASRSPDGAFCSDCLVGTSRTTATPAGAVIASCTRGGSS
jgi:hypothetical protein